MLGPRESIGPGDGLQTKPFREAEQVAVRVLDQELSHPGLVRACTITDFLDVHEQRPAHTTKRIQKGCHLSYLDLEVDPPAERPLQGSRDPPASGLPGLLQHDLDP